MPDFTALRRLDRRLSRRVQRLALGALDWPLTVPALIFGEYGVPLLLLGLWWRAGGRVALAVGLTSLLLLVLTTWLKRRVGRRRPVPLAHRAVPLRRLVGNPAFPSGDAAQAALFTVLAIGAGEGAWRWGMVLALPLCMFGRVYFGAHWWGDTVGGALIGASLAGVALAFRAIP